MSGLVFWLLLSNHNITFELYVEMHSNMSILNPLIVMEQFLIQIQRTINVMQKQLQQQTRKDMTTVVEVATDSLYIYRLF